MRGCKLCRSRLVVKVEGMEYDMEYSTGMEEGVWRRL